MTSASRLRLASNVKQIRRNISGTSEPKKRVASGFVASVQADAQGRVGVAQVQISHLGGFSHPIPVRVSSGDNIYSGQTVAMINDGSPSQAIWRIANIGAPGGTSGGSIINQDGNIPTDFDNIHITGDGTLAVGGQVQGGVITGAHTFIDEKGWKLFDPSNHLVAGFWGQDEGTYDRLAGDAQIGKIENYSGNVLFDNRGGSLNIRRGTDDIIVFGGTYGNRIVDWLNVGPASGPQVGLGADVFGGNDEAAITLRDSSNRYKVVIRSDSVHDDGYLYVGGDVALGQYMKYENGQLIVDGDIITRQGLVTGTVAIASDPAQAQGLGEVQASGFLDEDGGLQPPYYLSGASGEIVFGGGEGWLDGTGVIVKASIETPIRDTNTYRFEHEGLVYAFWNNLVSTPTSHSIVEFFAGSSTAGVRSDMYIRSTGQNYNRVNVQARTVNGGPDIVASVEAYSAQTNNERRIVLEADTLDLEPVGYTPATLNNGSLWYESVDSGGGIGFYGQQDGRAVKIPGIQWRNVWLDTETYYRYDMVRAAAWTMIANKTTDENPMPQAVGVPEWARNTPGTPPAWSETTASTSQLIVGQRFTYTDNGYLTAVGFYLPSSSIGFNCEVWLIQDPTGNPRYTQVIGNFVIDSDDVDKWVDIPQGFVLITADTTFDVAMVMRPVSGETQFTYPWNYVRGNGDPASGNANHQSGGNQNQIRFHQEDNNGVNRSTDLDNIGPGSKIEMLSSGFVWDVIGANKAGSVYTFIVEPASRAGAALSDFRFSYYGALAIPYVYATDWYLGTSSIRSIFSTTGYENVSLADNLYGIDIEFQAVQFSPDWDVVAFSG